MEATPHVRRLRSVLSLLSLVTAGDGIVGADVKSLAFRSQLAADAERIRAEIGSLPDGPRLLRRAEEACPRCEGKKYLFPDTYSLDGEPCPRCHAEGYRHRADAVTKPQRRASL